MGVAKDVNLRWLFENVRSEFCSVSFLQRFNIIPTSKKCKKTYELTLQIDGGRLVEYGGEVNHDNLSSHATNLLRRGRINTWLEGSTLAVEKIILQIYSWSKEYASIKFPEEELGINKNVMVDFNYYLREVNLLFEHYIN